MLDLSELARQVDDSWEKMDQEAREAREAARIEQMKKAILAEASAPVSEEELQKLLRKKEEQIAMHAKSSPSRPDYRLISLVRLAARYLSLNLVKGKMSRSNWENHLSEGQITCMKSNFVSCNHLSSFCRCCQRRCSGLRYLSTAS
jgi:hypothetical protein